MYIRHNNILAFRKNWAWTLALLSVCLMYPLSLQAQSKEKIDPEVHRFKHTRGLRLFVLKSDHIDFIHAQLIIYYNEKAKNPAIPFITVQNLFDRNLKESDTPLLSILKRMGNDYEIEQRPDFLLFKINFLPDKMSLFLRFLKTLYSYKPFLDLNSPTNSYIEEKRKISAQNRFNDSISNYWNYFFKQDDWKTRIAYRIAYNHFFPSAIMGQTLIGPNDVKRVTMEQLRSYYMKTYQLSNSLLFIKGNIENPAILHGHIERTFSNFKVHPPQKPVEENLTINTQEKIYIFDTHNGESPVMYWFELIPIHDNGNPLPLLVLNNILFAYPTGRLYINSRYSEINNLRIQTEMMNHESVSIIANSIQLKYSDVGKFILLADRERKKLRAKQVERKEYLNTFSNIYGRLKVNTQDYENDVSLRIIKSEYHSQKISLASLNKISEESDYSLIVIVGNAKMIMPHLNLFQSKVEVIDFLLP